MTKGKHKTLSERRKEVSEELSNLSSLQQKITDLIKENKRLSEAIKISEEKHAKDVIELNILVDTKSSKALKKLENTVEEMSTKLEDSKKEYKELHDKWSRLLDGIIDYFKYTEKTSGLVALEKLYMIGHLSEITEDLDDKNKCFIVTEEAKYLSDKNISKEEHRKRIVNLQKIRGIR